MNRHALLAMAVGLLLAACSAFTTSIKEIQDHPRDYADKEITIAGEVKKVYGLLVVRYFMLDDGTGEIGVITERPLPQRGERLRITGTVREAFSLGERTAVVLVEKSAEPGKADKP